MKDWLIVVAFAALIIALGIAYGFVSSPANAQDWTPDHLDFLAGPSYWGDTSNGNEVESDSDLGAAAAVSLGWGLDWLSADITAGYWNEPLHGQNRTLPDGRESQKTSDGGRGHFGAIMPGFWPKVDLNDVWTLYGGGGAGLGYARIYGEGDLTYAYQAGGGLLFSITEEWSAHLAYRYTGFGKTEHDGLEARFDAHTALIGVRYVF